MSGAPTTPGTRIKKRILIADDDPSISRLLERVLVTEFDVVTASDGNAAFALAGQIRPQLFILDVMMPGMDGFQLAGKDTSRPGAEERPDHLPDSA